MKDRRNVFIYSSQSQFNSLATLMWLYLKCLLNIIIFIKATLRNCWPSSSWSIKLHVSCRSFSKYVSCALAMLCVLLLCIYPVQPVCTVLLILLFITSKVYCPAHLILLQMLFLFVTSFFHTYIYVYCVVFVSHIIALLIERTWLTFHYWLYSV